MAYIAPSDHRAELAESALRLLARQLMSAQIAYIWPELNRIAFRTADGRTGDVEVLLNWDVVASTESTADGSVTR